MTVGDFLDTSVRRLVGAGVATARLDTLVLLEDATGRGRASLLAHPELPLSNEQQSALAGQLDRRARHEPLAYIRGRTEFYGRGYYVDSRVLEPRPESETMIDLLKQLELPPGGLVIDVGTGSGALAITVACELPQTQVMAIDIDPGCLEVARRNAEAHGAAVSFVKGDLLIPLQDGDRPIGALLCNLPYVPDDFHINTAAGHEPTLALFGGADGLDPYRRLFGQITTMSAAVRPRYVLTEAMPPQHKTLADIADTAGYSAELTEDFIQVFSLPLARSPRR